MMLRVNFLARHKVGPQQFLTWFLSVSAAPWQRMFDIPVADSPESLTRFPLPQPRELLTNCSGYITAPCKEQVAAPWCAQWHMNNLEKHFISELRFVVFML